MANPTETKAGPSFIKEIDLEARTVTGITAVMGNVDDGGDIIHRGAFKKTILESPQRVRHLWNHNSNDPPIATILSLQEVGKGGLPKAVKENFPDAKGGLEVTRKYFKNARAEQVFEALTSKPPAINEMSIGFMPVKFDFDEKEISEDRSLLVRNLRELRLFDTSDVNWGMNAATVASKTTLLFKDTGKDPLDAEWSSPALSDFTDEQFEDLTPTQKNRIAAHFAFTENSPPESFGDLKLPFKRPSLGEVGKAVWRGTAAAMDALLGARGGVSIPRKDRRSVYNALLRYYEIFDKEPPDFKVVELAQAIQAVLTLEDLGPTLNPQELQKLLELLSAEPQNALTVDYGMELELRKRELEFLALQQ